MRVIHPDDPERIEVREEQVFAAAQLVRLAVRALRDLLLGLHAEEPPVFDAAHQDFMAHVVLDGDLIHHAGRFRLGNKDAGLGVGACAPNILENAAAVFGDPQAPILRIPWAVGVVVRGAGGVVGRHVFGLRRDLAVAADEFYVVHIGAAAGHPFAADSARVARRGVDADAADELPPAPAGFQHGLRRAHTGPRRAVFIDGDLRGDGAEAEERAAAAHAERIRDTVHALRQVDGRALVERRLQRGRVVGGAVADGAEITGVCPQGLRGQTDNLAQKIGGEIFEGIRFREAHPLGFGVPQRAVVAVQQRAHNVCAAAPGQDAPAFPAAQQCGDIAAPHVLQIDLRAAVFLLCDLQGGPGDVLQNAVLPEQLFPIAVLGELGGGRVADLDVAEGQPAFSGADGGAALPAEGAFDQDEGPAGRALCGVDAVIAAEEHQVFHLVSHIENAGLAFADVENTVGDEAVLCKMGAQRDGGRVSRPNAEIDVGDGAVKGAGVRVLNLPVDARHVAGEPEKVGGFALVLFRRRLKAGGVGPQNEPRPFLPEADHAHGAGQVDGAADRVVALGDQHDAAAAALLDAVQKALQAVCHVAESVLARDKAACIQDGGLRVVRLHGVNGCAVREAVAFHIDSFLSP